MGMWAWQIPYKDPWWSDACANSLCKHPRSHHAIEDPHSCTIGCYDLDEYCGCPSFVEPK